MSWIRQNRFLASFYATTAVGAIALSALTYVQYDKYSAVSEDYVKQAAELKRLQSLTPYPSEENLKKLKLQRQTLDGNIQTLQAGLGKMELSVAPTSPEQFQDKLRSTVLAVADTAKQNSVKLPEKEKFYLGFDLYQAQPPKASATAGLMNQLAGIETVTKLLLENKVAQIDSVKRAPLPEEDQKNAAQPGAPAQKTTAASAGALRKTSFEIAFKADLKQARKVINSIVTENKQFLIIRALRIDNENPKAPSKKGIDENQAGAAPADPSKPAGSAAASALKYILGAEKVNVVAQVEIVNFKGNPGK